MTTWVTCSMRTSPVASIFCSTGRCGSGMGAHFSLRIWRTPSITPPPPALTSRVVGPVPATCSTWRIWLLPSASTLCTTSSCSRRESSCRSVEFSSKARAISRRSASRAAASSGRAAAVWAACVTGWLRRSFSHRAPPTCPSQSPAFSPSFLATASPAVWMPLSITGRKAPERLRFGWWVGVHGAPFRQVQVFRQFLRHRRGGNGCEGAGPGPGDRPTQIARPKRRPGSNGARPKHKRPGANKTQGKLFAAGPATAPCHPGPEARCIRPSRRGWPPPKVSVPGHRPRPLREAARATVSRRFEPAQRYPCLTRQSVY